jgi:hypothetical protein
MNHLLACSGQTYKRIIKEVKLRELATANIERKTWHGF